MHMVWLCLLRLFRRVVSLGRSPRLFRTSAILVLLVQLAVMPWGLQCAPRPTEDDTTPLLPSPAQAVGATRGDFSVSATGQPEYSLPIAVPPGRAGIEPHLSLGYRGGRQRTSLGRGFFLQGISAIGRCGSSMGQDGHRRPVALDAGDHLCLGGRRLVELAKDVAGPGGNATEYRTLPDTGARVLGYLPQGAAADAVDSFEVYSASGLIATYGKSPDAKQMGQQGVVRAWWLSEERDRSGNAVIYTYQRSRDEGDGHTLEIEPLRIDYTATVGASGEVLSPGSRHVEFGYTTDSTRGDLFYRGLKVQSAQVLSSIRTKVNDTAVRTYGLATAPTPSAGALSSLGGLHFEDALGRDLLEHVTECAGDGSNPAACRPATQFNWSTRLFDGRFTPDEALDTTLGTTTHVPTVQEDEHYAWLLADVTGDGLADLVEAKDGPEKKTVVWSVLPNLGGVFGPPSAWAEFALPPGFGEGTGEWSLGVLDYDDDGVADILVDYESPRAAGEWTTLKVLLSRPAGSAVPFVLTDTGIPRLKTRGDPSVFPFYDTESVAAWMLADMNGDGKADLLQCEDLTTEPASESYVAQDCLDHPPCHVAASRWTIAYWVPTGSASGGAGFEASSSVELPGLKTLSCWTMGSHVTALDADGNGVTDLLFPDPATGRFQRLEIDTPSNAVEQHPLGETVGAPSPNTAVVGKTSPRFWHEMPDHSLALAPVLEDRYLFPDLNGDGVADVVFFVEQGPGLYAGPVTQYLTGDGGVVDKEVLENIETGGGAHAFDLYPYARVVDYDADGRDDLLVPEAYACDPGPYCVRYVVWRSAKLGEPSRRVELDIAPPGASDLGERYAMPLSTYKKRLQMRITDLDADGTADLVFPGGGGGPFKAYTNRGKSDLLTEIATGENPLTPPSALFCPHAPEGRCAGGDPDFHPDITITYGRLTSPPPGTSDAEASVYTAHVDAKSTCVYPRGCTVSQEPVVAGYTRITGDNQPRRFSLQYQDGRFDRRGYGFLGFGSVLRRDDDTGATSIEQFDNVTYEPALRAYPYAGMAVRRASYVRAASTDADPTRVDMTSSVSEPLRIPTWGGLTYYVTSAAQTETVEVGHVNAEADAGTVRAYVLDPNHAAVTVRKAQTSAKDFDAFGHARQIEQWTEGLDELTVTDSIYSEDLNLWLVGKLKARTNCSTDGGKTQCQTVEADDDPLTGLVTEVRRAPELDRAFLKTHLERDAHGNVTHRIEDDKLGHHRESWVSYEAEGYFPATLTNALNQVTTLTVDPATGQKLVEVDINGHVQKWDYDAFGLLTELRAFDGTVTHVRTQRTKSGTPGANFWQTMITTTTEGRDSRREVLDSQGRVVERAERGPKLPMLGADGQLSPPGSWIVEEQRYTLLGQLAFRSVSHGEGDTSATPGTRLLYDQAGRPVEIDSPSGATALYAYGYGPGSTSIEATTTAPPDAAQAPKTKTVFDVKGRVTEVHDAAGGVVRYGYEPFDRLHEVTAADLTSTVVEYDPYGRTVHLHDPDKGDSDSLYDGFDELEQTTDALARTTSYHYDDLGRVHERTSAEGLTRYTYDTKPNGKGMLGRVEQVNEGIVREFSFDTLSRPVAMELSQGGGALVTKAERVFDGMSRVRELRYPTQPGMTGFSVFYAYDDSSGELVAVTDGQGKDYYRLHTVDGQGHAVEEQYGAEMTRARRFDPATGALMSLRTTAGAMTLQDWTYAYDTRGNLLARYDLLQPDAAKTSEVFHYDLLDRLTCSRFAACRPGDLSCYGVAPSPASCDLFVSYDPGGNITSKSDVGTYSYDPNHPHAVQSLMGPGAASYAYDEVGNQVERPGVLGKIRYTSLDLPSSYTTSKGDTAITYDDQGERIRKLDPAQDTLYFGDIYERVTTATGVEDRYYLSHTEGVFAVASRSSAEQETPELRYVLTDRLGSPDVITDASGSVALERHSYDAFGARRNAAWGKTLPPPSGPPEITAMGFTGHALDAEVGLVNAKGRLYDPKLGRFLQVDPLVTDLFNAQRWNSYSYALNNPLRYTDPTGLDGEAAAASDFSVIEFGPAFGADHQIDPAHVVEWHCTADGYSECRGITVPAPAGEGGLGTTQTGSAAEEASAQAALSDLGAAVDRTAQAWSGFFVGLGLGLTPGGAVTDQVLSTARAIPEGTGQARIGKAIGEMLGGLFLAASGVTGEVVGTGLTTTGIGGVLGVPAMAVSAALVTSGAGNMAAGLQGFADALLSSGSGTTGPQAAAPAAGGAVKRIDPNKLKHIFGKPEHALNDFVHASGGQEQALRRIQDAANVALHEGKLTPGPNGILPSGNAGYIIDVGGTQIRLIGGRVVEGAVEIGSVSRMGLP